MNEEEKEEKEEDTEKKSLVVLCADQTSKTSLKNCSRYKGIAGHMKYPY